MKCRRCDKTNFVSQNYETENESEVMEVVKAEICTNCGCAHWDNEYGACYEYVPYYSMEVNNVGGWATNMN